MHRRLWMKEVACAVLTWSTKMPSFNQFDAWVTYLRSLHHGIRIRRLRNKQQVITHTPTLHPDQKSPAVQLYGCTQRCIISMFPHLSRVSISLQEFQGSSTTIERATFTLIHMNLILTMYPTELMKYIFAVDVWSV